MEFVAYRKISIGKNFIFSCLRGFNLLFLQSKTNRNMKNVLKLLGQFLIGAVIGLGFVWLMIWLIDGENMFSVISNGSKDVKAWKVALSCLCTFTSLIIAVVLNFALHETGHLLGGLATGFNFLSIRLFKYALVKDEDGLHLKKFNIAGTGGQCLMDFSENIDAEKVPYFWYNAGGFLVNLLIAVISVVLLANFDLGMFGDAFFFMMAFVGFACFLMNALPVSFNGMQNDGSNILTLWRDKSSRKYFYRVILMAGRLSRGVRAKDIPLSGMRLFLCRIRRSISNSVCALTILLIWKIADGWTRQGRFVRS